MHPIRSRACALRPRPPRPRSSRSRRPQRPKKKYGAGRFEGEGYLGVLAQWDAENRARDAADARDKPDYTSPLPGAGPREKLPPPKTDALPLPKVPPLPMPKEPPLPMPKEPSSVQWRPKGGTLPPPSVTMERDSGVIVASGQLSDGNKTVPAVVVVPRDQPGLSRGSGRS